MTAALPILHNFVVSSSHAGNLDLGHASDTATGGMMRAISKNGCLADDGMTYMGNVDDILLLEIKATSTIIPML
jgi:hypothetical protein